MYRYLIVRSDRLYGESVPACVLGEHLDSVPGLRRTDLAFYTAEDGLDWLHVTIAACDGAGNYAAHAGRVPERVNMVELICSSADGHPAYEALQELAVKIADLLAWEVADSESDEVLYARPSAGTTKSWSTSTPCSADRRTARGVAAQHGGQQDTTLMGET